MTRIGKLFVLVASGVLLLGGSPTISGAKGAPDAKKAVAISVPALPAPSVVAAGFKPALFGQLDDASTVAADHAWRAQIVTPALLAAEARLVAQILRTGKLPRLRRAIRKTNAKSPSRRAPSPKRTRPRPSKSTK